MEHETRMNGQTDPTDQSPTMWRVQERTTTRGRFRDCYQHSDEGRALEEYKRVLSRLTRAGTGAARMIDPTGTQRGKCTVYHASPLIADRLLESANTTPGPSK